jgi:hypothetical protein
VELLTPCKEVLFVVALVRFASIEEFVILVCVTLTEDVFVVIFRSVAFTGTVPFVLLL